MWMKQAAHPGSLFRRKMLPHLLEVPVQPAPELPGIERLRFVAGKNQDPVGLGDQDIERRGSEVRRSVRNECPQDAMARRAGA
jgi:hypothetical protein